MSTNILSFRDPFTLSRSITLLLRSVWGHLPAQTWFSRLRIISRSNMFKFEEIDSIMKDFAKLGSLAPTGLFLGGTKYMVIRGEPGAVIRGKKGLGGVTVKKTGQALIIGIYDEPMTPGQCNMILERLGDYLIEQGL